jgi:hypothetical protein
MEDVDTLSHTTWDCKYNVAFRAVSDRMYRINSGSLSGRVFARYMRRTRE